MITTVTLNPCNDLTFNISNFVYGGMNRVLSQRFDFAGKGFNVARIVSRLGEKATATGFLYDENGKDMQKSLIDEGVTVDCIWKQGKIRTNIKLFDEKKKVITEVNEQGVFASKDDVDEVFKKIIELADNSDFLVLSGSICPGCEDDIYSNIIRFCSNNTKIILDAEGKKLSLGIEQKPFMIKPNLFELETALNKTLETNEDIKNACREIIEKGVEIVAVSMGERGLIIADNNKTIFAPPIKDLQVLGTVGAGDSMVAAFAVSLKRGLPLEEVCKQGVAAASGCVSRAGTDLVTKQDIEQLLPKVEIVEI